MRLLSHFSSERWLLRRNPWVPIIPMLQYRLAILRLPTRSLDVMRLLSHFSSERLPSMRNPSGLIIARSRRRSARREHAQRACLMLLLDRPTTPGPATETSNRAADRSANHKPSDE